MASSKRLLQASTRVKDANSGSIIPHDHWARFVNHDQEGMGDYSDYAGSDDIVPDADGYYPAGDRYRIAVDLSNAMSSIIGKQCPMTANYRLKGLGIRIRPVDDWLDNEAGGCVFSGDVKYLLPNKHNIDAIQACRQLENYAEESGLDSDSTWMQSTQANYKGFRFGWRTELDVAAPTTEGFSLGAAVEGGAASWNLYNDDGALGMMDLWRTYKDLNPTQSNTLWEHRIGNTSKFGWMAGWLDDAEAGSVPEGDFLMMCPPDNHIEILGGLLMIDFTHSTLREGIINSNEYHVYVDVHVEGWEAF